MFNKLLLVFTLVIRKRPVFLLTVLTLLLILSFPSAKAQLKADFTADTLTGCPPLIVQFTDQSEGHPITWKWEFGNGNSSVLQNPETVYDQPGTYAVTLTVKNGTNSNKIIKQKYITISDTPEVDFLASPSSGCYPLNVDFRDHSKAGKGTGLQSWLWDFGDGNISHKPNPSHLYDNAGKFNVSLSVTNKAGCSSGITRKSAVVTNEGVKADFTADQTVSCAAPMMVHFKAQTGGNQQITFLWDFGDGGTGSGATAVHTYNQNGVYTVTLRASIVNGCTDTVVKKNFIHAGSFNSDFELPQGCAKVPLTFKNTSSPLPDSAVWYFSDGTVIRDTNAVHQFSKPGTYTVKLVNIYGSCKDMVTKTLTTFPSPEAAFEAVTQNYCNSPAAVTFKNLSQDAVSAQWDFGDNTTSTKMEPAHTYNKNGHFDVKLTVRNEQGCVDSVMKSGYIQVMDPEVQFIARNNSGCVPLTVQFEDKINSPDSIVRYFWDFGDGQSSTSADPSHKYTKEGTYDVKLKIITASGCEDSLVRKGFVHTGTPPSIKFTATPKVACLETPVQFTNLSQPTGMSWEWTFPDDGGTTETAENPLHHFHNLGKHNVVLTVNNNGCEASDTVMDFITVKAPKAAMEATQSCEDPYTVTFKDQSQLATEWEWDFGDGSTFHGQNPPPHTYSATGTYKIKLVVKNGECVSTTGKTIHIIDLHPILEVSSGIVCHGTKVNFALENTTDTKWIKSYTWVLGNGEIYTTTASDTTLVYAKNGAYEARLITTNINGCKDTSATVQITVRGPEADFVLSPSTTCRGTKVTFKDNSTISGAPIRQWEWDFGDGIKRTLSKDSAVHAYHKGGKYRIQLEVQDENGCSDKRTHYNAVSIYDVEAAFSTVDSMICPGAPINWINKSTGNKLTYQWDFGDNTTGSQQIPAKTYLNEGIYTVSLKVESPLGCRDSVTKEKYIRVGAPHAKMDYADNNASCPPFVVSVSNQSENYRRILWDFGDGTTSNNTDTARHVYTIPGNYQLKMYVYGYSAGCMDSIVRTVAVAGPYGTPKVVDSVGCSPHDVQFSATAVNTVSYRWDFGDGLISPASSLDEATHTYKEAGIFQPKLGLTDDRGCLVFIPTKHKIMVDAVDIDPVYTIPDICDTSILQFQTQGLIFSQDSLHFPASYQWNFGEPGSTDNTSTSPEPQHDYANPGTYPVEVRINTIYGCDSKETINVIVPEPYVMQVTASPADTAVCRGTPAFLHASGANRYVWTPSAGLSNTESATPVALPENTTNYQVVGYSKGDCQSDTAKVQVVVNDRPGISMPQDTTIGTGSSIQLPVTYSPDAINWEWTPEEYLSCAHCATPVSTPHKPMSYRVVAANQWGCTDTASIKINLVCKQGKVFIPNTFTPNNDGTNDIFYPRGKGVREVLYFRIYNRWGQLIYVRSHFKLNDKSAGWDGTFNDKLLNPGVYVYQTSMRCESGDVFKLDGNITLLR